MNRVDAREVALEVLTACRKADAWADGALKHALSRYRLDSRDAALAARLTYGILQNRMLLDYRIAGFCRGRFRDLEPVVLDILRIGAYQILMMDKIPHSAAVNQAVEMAKGHHRAKAAGMVNAILRNLSREKDRLPEIRDLSVRYSHPGWLTDCYIALLGREEAEEAMAANNVPVPITIQRNPLHASEEVLEAELPEAEAHPWLEGCYFLHGAGNLETSEPFLQGHFLVQDTAARLAVMAAGCRPGDRVLDICAAPGGKSFAAAAAMEDRGEILSCDIHSHKLNLMEKGAQRLGVTCMRTLLSDGRVFREELANWADVVICDVPCSGLGIIRKKPDIRYKRMEDLARLPEIQLAILTNAANYVRPGGTLLYSTCTILPQENQQVTERFLAADSRFSKEAFTLSGPIGTVNGDITLWPQRHQTDGFYICKLRREND